LKLSKFFEHPIVSSVIAGIILTLPIGVWGEKAIGIFKGNLEIPAWLILLLFFIFFSLVIYSFKITVQLWKSEKFYKNQTKISESFTSLASTVNRALEEQNKLSEIEVTILQMHAGMKPGYGLTCSELEDDLKLHREEGQYYLEKLEEKGYIEFAFTADNDESAYQLAKKGRSYLVENKLLPIQDKGTQQT
jgi:hypothetical protein